VPLNISETVQDTDIASMEYALLKGVISNDLERPSVT